jgi:hypothetical protein
MQARDLVEAKEAEEVHEIIGKGSKLYLLHWRDTEGDPDDTGACLVWAESIDDAYDAFVCEEYGIDDTEDPEDDATYNRVKETVAIDIKRVLITKEHNKQYGKELLKLKRVPDAEVELDESVGEPIIPVGEGDKLYRMWVGCPDLATPDHDELVKATSPRDCLFTALNHVRDQLLHQEHGRPYTEREVDKMMDRVSLDIREVLFNRTQTANYGKRLLSKPRVESLAEAKVQSKALKDNLSMYRNWYIDCCREEDQEPSGEVWSAFEKSLTETFNSYARCEEILGGGSGGDRHLNMYPDELHIGTAAGDGVVIHPGEGGIEVSLTKSGKLQVSNTAKADLTQGWDESVKQFVKLKGNKPDYKAHGKYLLGKGYGKVRSYPPTPPVL